MDLSRELSHEGVEPKGPCSAWPEERHWRLMAESVNGILQVTKTSSGATTYTIIKKDHATKVEASPAKMAEGLIKSGLQAFSNGRVAPEIREERYDTCKACPMFIEDSKRCSSCGCFMEAKTWIGGDPNTLCPLKKWSR